MEDKKEKKNDDRGFCCFTWGIPNDGEIVDTKEKELK